MKSIAAVETALKNEHVVRVVPEAVIDWNMNRYIGAVANNTPDEQDEGFDIEMFPIESIIEPIRPTKGINKARVGSATIGDDYTGAVASPNGRFYLADVDDPYKYWTSPEPSNASTGAIAKVKPQVVYNSTVSINKIVFTFENSWASPKTFSIQATTSATPTDTTGAGGWTEIANQTTVGNGWKASGQIVMHWNGSAWVANGRVDNEDKTPRTTTLRGIRIVVTALESGYKITDGVAVPSTYGEYVGGVFTTKSTTGKDAFFDLIEISGRLEVDISDYVMDTEDSFDMGDADNLYPLGQVTSNQAGLTLSNLYFNGTEWVPGLFNANNTNSPYANFIEENAEINLRYHYYDENDVYLGAVQQFKMYADTWAGQADETVSVDLTDYSKFFNDVQVRAAMWENLTVPQIVWRILDSVGFTNYHIDSDADIVTEHVIPVFYTDGTNSVWEVLSDLAKASQTAIYMDGFGTLQVKTRDFAFSPADAPVWELTSENDANQLANIVTLEQTTEFEPNHYKVIYQKTNWSPMTKGQPTMQKVWEPEGTEVLRGTPLVRTLELGANYFWLSAADVRVWPYAGIVNIGGELIKYEGKQFVYYTGTSGQTRNVKVVTSMDEHKSRSAETPWQYRHKNGYTGALKIVERGYWNSEEKRHPVEAEGYSARNIINGVRKGNARGVRHFKQESKLGLNTPNRFKDYKDLLVVTRGASDDTPFYYYGTKFKFVKGHPHQFAGIVIHNNSGTEDGYYIEFTPSKNLSGKERKNRNELIVYSRVNGKDKRIGGDGSPLAIGENIWYEVDVTYINVPNSGDHRLQVWVNGKNVFNRDIGGSNRNAANGKFGMFARGKTNVEYEYIYAVRRQGKEPADDFSFLDKVERGYTGNQWDREWVYEWKTYRRRVRRKWRKEQKRWNLMYFDDFGPYVHEVREYDVKFDPSPVLHTRLYVTNDWSAAVLDYRATPFGAKFTVANTRRENAVVHGEDKLSYSGTNQSINQILTVFGRALVIDEAQEVIAKNDDQIRRRGKIESELSSQWIQSERMAKEIANWMEDRFSYGNEEITVEIFGNPLIEIADVVHVNYPDKHIDDDYFVIGARSTFNNGLVTTLSLRRRV